MDRQDMIKRRLEKKEKKILLSKRKNRIKTIKYTIVFVLIQVVILVVIGGMFHQTRYATIENTESISGYADYVQERSDPFPLLIYMNSTEYYFDSDTYLYFQEDKVSNRRDHLSSEKLTIRYYKVFGKSAYTIVDIRSSEYVYYTIEEYNECQKLGRIEIVTFLILIEGIYLVILFFAVLYWHDSVTEIKDRFKKLRKQQAMNKTD